MSVICLPMTFKWRSRAFKRQIMKPAAGTVFYLDPDIPAEEQCVSLRAEAPASVEWSSDMFARIDISSPRVQLREGRHLISARDPETGETAQVWIEVRVL